MQHLVDLYEVGQAEARRGRGARPMPQTGRGALELRGVWFGYAGRQAVLCGLDLTLRPGEIVALVGENGAGKTTLVNVATRLVEPQRGHVLLDGIDAGELDLDGYRAQFAVLSQDYARMALSALHNVGVGWVEHVDDVERVARAAKLAGADVLTRLPNGWETPLTEAYHGGVELSGGQWQQVALARVLLSQAPVVILDEPTAALDAHREHEVYTSLRRLLAGRTVLFITHRLWSASVANRVLLLHEGRIVEEGTHDELVAGGGRYAELWRLQVEAMGGGRPPAAPRPGPRA
jgi:ATP-binding cassette subfamily B protein